MHAGGHCGGCEYYRFKFIKSTRGSLPSGVPSLYAAYFVSVKTRRVLRTATERETIQSNDGLLHIRDRRSKAKDNLSKAKPAYGDCL